MLPLLLQNYVVACACVRFLMCALSHPLQTLVSLVKPNVSLQILATMENGQIFYRMIPLAN